LVAQAGGWSAAFRVQPTRPHFPSDGDHRPFRPGYACSGGVTVASAAGSRIRAPRDGRIGWSFRECQLISFTGRQADRYRRRGAEFVFRAPLIARAFKRLCRGSRGAN
jgi:hypothetical protein